MRAVHCARELNPSHHDLTLSATPKNALRLPPAGTHPAIVAQKLLALALFLQCARPLTAQLHGIMTRAVEAARYLVTSRDDLVDCIEGIECLIMEATFESNAGNLHRAWLAARRAMTMAQMIDLEDTASPPAAGDAGAEQRTSNSPIDPKHMWFRVIQTDRYLSLMSGLPQGTDTDSFTDAEALQPFSPVERLHRIHCTAAGRLLRRRKGRNSAMDMQEIDRLLQDAAECVPAQWWLVPVLLDNGSDETLEEISRMMDQITHYHLVVQLHLPQVLLSEENGCLHSTLSALSASREVMTRYMAVKNASKGEELSYCSSLDSIAFVSGVCLCWVHIGYSNQGVYGFEHQRQGDRAMVGWLVDNLRRRGREHVSAQLLVVLERLLEIELDVASSSSSSYCSYSAVLQAGSTAGDRVKVGCGGRLSDDGSLLHICIPCLGEVAIQRSSMSENSQWILPNLAELAPTDEESSLDVMAFLQAGLVDNT